MSKFRAREGSLGPRIVLSQKFIADLPHGSRGEVLRVAVVTLDGDDEKKAEIRQWVTVSEGELRPSHFGVRVPLRCAPDIAEALLAAVAAEGNGDGFNI
jgi:hypothetical protein